MSEDPQEIVEAANAAAADLLPDKSRAKYTAVYSKFMEYRADKNLTSLSENVLLAYFSDLATTRKASTLWSLYSMLKSTLLVKHNVDIRIYHKLQAF